MEIEPAPEAPKDLQILDPRKPLAPLPELVPIMCPSCRGSPIDCPRCNALGSVLVDMALLKVWSI